MERLRKEIPGGPPALRQGGEKELACWRNSGRLVVCSEEVRERESSRVRSRENHAGS